MVADAGGGGSRFSGPGRVRRRTGRCGPAGSAPDPQVDRGAVALLRRTGEAHGRLRADAGGEHVRAVGGVRLPAARVGGDGGHRVVDPLVEVELAGVHDLSADVHLDVDVRGAAAVPAGVEGVEGDGAVLAGDLDAAQEALPLGSLPLHPGVDTGERARVAADLADAHAATLTALLGALRSHDLDDRSARRAAAELAADALIEVRSPRREPAEDEPTAGEAFREMAHKLTLLMRYNDARLELSAPEDRRHPLPAEVAGGARATVRAAVLTMLDQRGVTRVRVAWRVEGNVLDVSVRDDGPGRLTGEASDGHRIATVLAPFAAPVSVDSVPGWGTTLTSRTPLGPAESPDGPQARLLATLNPRESEVLQE